MATNTKTTALLSSTTGEVKSLWSHLTEPDTHFDNVGWYKITFVTDEPTGIQLNSQLEKLHNQAKQDYISAGKDVRSENKSGGKKVDNEDGTVHYEFTAKMRPYFMSKKDGKKIINRPQIVGADLKPYTLDQEIPRGSTIKVNFKVVPYCTALAMGLTMRLGGVQVINLADTAFSSDHGFTVVEEGNAVSQSTGNTTPDVSGNTQTETASAADF